MRLIDADALIDKLPKEYLGSIIHAMINEAPTIEPKRGEWIKRKRKCEYKCSECGKIVFADDENELNFCCSCGARMKERASDEIQRVRNARWQKSCIRV